MLASSGSNNLGNLGSFDTVIEFHSSNKRK